MKKQRYIVEIEMPDGDFISAGWLKDLIQTDCDVEDESRKKVTVQETSLPSNLDEAAEEYGHNTFINECMENGVCDDHDLSDAFKAGAEWRDAQIPKLPDNVDEAAFAYENAQWEAGIKDCGYCPQDVYDAFKAGAEWMAGQGWIDDGSMPPETKRESDTLQGHREWTESEPVLAWDSMYGCRVDWTRNGKWMSEQRGGYTGQVCHGIIAWRPIPEYKEKQ